MSRAFSISGEVPQRPVPGIWVRLPPSLKLYLLHRRRLDQVQEFIEVLFRPLNTIPSQGQQFYFPEHSLSQALFFLPESS